MKNENNLIFFKNFRSSRPDVLLRKGVLKIYSKFTGEHPCKTVISIKLFCKFIEFALRDCCSPVNLLHVFRTPFIKNTSGWLFLKLHVWIYQILERSMKILTDSSG